MGSDAPVRAHGGPGVTRIALAAGAVALAGRLILLVALPELAVKDDALLYQRIADGLSGDADGRLAGGFYRGWGFPFLLAGLDGLGLGYAPIRIFQALLWAAAATLATLTSGRLFGRRAAIATAALTLVQPLLWPHFLWLLTENLQVVLLAGSWALLLLRRPGQVRSAVLFGVLVGATALTHPGWQLFAPLALVALWHRRDALIAGVTAVGLTLAVIVPLHLAHPDQPWIYGQGNAGYGGGSAWTFYVGTRLDTGGEPGPDDYAAAEQRTYDDEYYWSEGIDNLLERPIDSAALFVGKIWQDWAPRDLPVITGTPLIDHLGRDLGGVTGALLVFAGIAGAARLWRRDRRLALTLVLPALYASVVFSALGTPDPRYVMATMPLLAIPAGLAFTRSATAPR